jgi:trk system potassium uptake protein TrkH
VKISAHSFVVVLAIALAAIAAGAVPLLLSGAVPTVIDAVFESVSAFTTTGVTLIRDVDALPPAVNLWRCFCQWLGALGIILYFLLAAEKSAQASGRLIAKPVTYAAFSVVVYTGWTALVAGALRIAGMSAFDAVAHSFTTVSTGGFSTHTVGLAYYHSQAISTVCALAMLFGGISFFTLYDFATGSWRRALRNSELRAYLLCLVVVTALMGVVMHSFSGAFFLATSYITTTGLGVQAGPLPEGVRMVLFLLLFVGGSSGSGAGGSKIMRWVILGKQLRRECLRMVHPNGVFTLRLNGAPMENDRRRVFSAVSLVFIFLFSVATCTFVAAFSGASLMDAFIAGLGTSGNSLANLGSTATPVAFTLLGPGAKLWFAFVMLAARFEFYQVLVLLWPPFWRR